MMRANFSDANSQSSSVKHTRCLTTMLGCFSSYWLGLLLEDLVHRAWIWDQKTRMKKKEGGPRVKNECGKKFS